MATIKKKYRALVSENHPDKVISQGLPEEFVKLATEKIQKINEAYEQIQKERGN
jgi:DnaJ like chaperone protein